MQARFLRFLSSSVAARGVVRRTLPLVVLSSIAAGLVRANSSVRATDEKKSSRQDDGVQKKGVSPFIVTGSLPRDKVEFNSKVGLVIEESIQKGSECVWLKVESADFDKLDYLVNSLGFRVHHGDRGYVMVIKDLRESERKESLNENYMPFASHFAASGGIVVNSKNEVLFVKEKSGRRSKTWGFPGGRIDKGETMHEAATREIREETGLICEAKDMFILRELEKFVFNRPDLYCLFLLRPVSENQQVKICEDEISAYKWVNIADLETFVEENKKLFFPMQMFVMNKLIAMNKAGYDFQQNDSVKQFLTTHNGSAYNIYMPIRGSL